MERKVTVSLKLYLIKPGFDEIEEFGLNQRYFASFNRLKKHIPNLP